MIAFFSIHITAEGMRKNLAQIVKGSDEEI